jgi:hypothetical protein
MGWYYMHKTSYIKFIITTNQHRQAGFQHASDLHTTRV